MRKSTTQTDSALRRVVVTACNDLIRSLSLTGFHFVTEFVLDAFGFPGLNFLMSSFPSFQNLGEVINKSLERCGVQLFPACVQKLMEVHINGLDGNEFSLHPAEIQMFRSTVKKMAVLDLRQAQELVSQSDSLLSQRDDSGFSPSLSSSLRMREMACNILSSCLKKFPLNTELRELIFFQQILSLSPSTAREHDTSERIAGNGF